MPFVKRVPPHPQPKYYVEYQAGGFLCYQRVEPATAHNNLLCIIDGRGVEPLVSEQHLDDADVDLLFKQMGGEAVA